MQRWPAHEDSWNSPSPWYVFKGKKSDSRGTVTQKGERATAGRGPRWTIHCRGRLCCCFSKATVPFPADSAHTQSVPARTLTTQGGDPDAGLRRQGTDRKVKFSSKILLKQTLCITKLADHILATARRLQTKQNTAKSSLKNPMSLRGWWEPVINPHACT